MEGEQSFINPDEISALLKNLYYDETQITQIANHLAIYSEHSTELSNIFLQLFVETSSHHTKQLILNLMHEIIKVTMNDIKDFVEAFGKHMLYITNRLV